MKDHGQGIATLAWTRSLSVDCGGHLLPRLPGSPAVPGQGSAEQLSECNHADRNSFRAMGGRPGDGSSLGGRSLLTLIGVVKHALAKIAVHNVLAGVGRVVSVQEGIVREVKPEAVVLACSRGQAGRQAKARQWWLPRSPATNLPAQRASLVGAAVNEARCTARIDPIADPRGQGPPHDAPDEGSVRKVSEPAMRTMHLAPMPFSRLLNGRTRTATLTLSAMATLRLGAFAEFLALGGPGGR